MFEAAPAEATDADELLDTFLRELRRVRESSPTAVEESSSPALDRGEAGAVTVTDAAAILATGSDRLDATAIEAELRDQLLIEMSGAVVDVDTLASEIDLERSGKELQQRIEGRASMTLREYAAIRHALAIRGS